MNNQPVTKCDTTKETGQATNMKDSSYNHAKRRRLNVHNESSTLVNIQSDNYEADKRTQSTISKSTVKEPVGSMSETATGSSVQDIPNVSPVSGREIDAPRGIHRDTMDAKSRGAEIVPTLYWFESNAREYGPYMDQWLVERLALEQIRRYENLISFKIGHAKVKDQGDCPSGTQCQGKGAEPIHFAHRPQSERGHAQSKFSKPLADDNGDDAIMVDGIVTEAQFPSGLPMPPIRRFPAQFECPFCFQVKSFSKPLDWRKHLHEDLQPFTCTFKDCSDPKSFKRKADWKRHEDERHRQLEWWHCTQPNCDVTCYRPEGFMQHLIREHKLPEPKLKTVEPSDGNTRGVIRNKVEDPGDNKQVPLDHKTLHIFEACRRVTDKKISDEPCRFCGKVCTSFKKLSNHLARHLETLSLPIFSLIAQKNISINTAIKPINSQQPN